MHIFVAASGRCGTGYLASGFGRFTNIGAFHEQPPVLKGPLLREANSLQMSETLKAKAKAISQNPFYIDTAHQFMRGFHRYALAEMPDLKLIKLARDPLEVARSRINRNVVPGRTPWLGLPDDPANMIQLPDSIWSQLSDLQKILLDWIEHEERFSLFRNEVQQVVYVTFEELTSQPNVTFPRLFDELGIRTYQLVDIDLNKNSNRVSTLVKPKDQIEFEALIDIIRSQDYLLNWLNEPYYQGLLKSRHVSAKEYALLEHYNAHPHYVSTEPACVLEQIPLPIQGRVLDLGCGDGRWSRYLQKRYGCEVTGVDFSAARIDRARQLSPGIDFYLANAYDYVLNYEGPPFDWVLMTEFLEHLENPELILSCLRRIAKGIVGTVPLNFPYSAHLQVFKSLDEFKALCYEWDPQCFLGKMSASSGSDNTIYFYTKQS